MRDREPAHTHVHASGMSISQVSTFAYLLHAHARARARAHTHTHTFGISNSLVGACARPLRRACVQLAVARPSCRHGPGQTKRGLPGESATYICPFTRGEGRLERDLKNRRRGRKLKEGGLMSMSEEKRWEL